MAASTAGSISSSSRTRPSPESRASRTTSRDGACQLRQVGDRGIDERSAMRSGDRRLPGLGGATSIASVTSRDSSDNRAKANAGKMKALFP